MLEPVFATLGLLNNIILIIIFLLRKDRMDLVNRFGWVYFLFAIPAVYALYLVQQEQKDVRFTIFLVIFLAFLAIEALYDWILKLSFREKPDWRILTPYVALYISSNYGFVVMTWHYYSLALGIVLLVLFIIQLIANLRSHPKPAPN